MPALAKQFGYAGVSTLRSATIAGRLQAIKPGRDWLSTAQWVEAFLAKAGIGGKPCGPRTSPNLITSNQEDCAMATGSVEKIGIEEDVRDRARATAIDPAPGSASNQ